MAAARHASASQTRPPVHAPASQGQPITSEVHVRQSPLSQVPPRSHAGTSTRQGQSSAPATQVSATQTAPVHSSPLPQTSPVAHGQLSSPGGQVSQSPDGSPQRNPVSQEPLLLHPHPSLPSGQATHTSSVQTPSAHAPASHAQPSSPGTHPASAPASAVVPASDLGLASAPQPAEAAPRRNKVAHARSVLRIRVA